MTAKPDDLTGEITVETCLARWPDAVGVFVRRQMACPGCVMAAHMTLDEVAAAYHLDAGVLLDEIAAAV